MPVIIQGITGRAGRTHAQLMQRYGTRVVGGVAASATASREPIAGIPVFASCADAVAATKARASLLMVPPLNVLARSRTRSRAASSFWSASPKACRCMTRSASCAWCASAAPCMVGPSTPGIAVPGRMKIGFLPDAALTPGPLGVMSKSGTLSYEVCYRLAQRGVGQSLWIGSGGDPVKGARFADLVPLFQSHAETQALLVIGEIGGTEEEELAEALIRARFTKPVFALLAGTTAPEGVTMGHAGALIHGTRGTAASKVAALGKAGVRVHATMHDIVEDAARMLAPAARVTLS